MEKRYSAGRQNGANKKNQNGFYSPFSSVKFF
jgi:hypothetical protein